MRQVVHLWRGALLATALLSVLGCSFQSTQYEFIKSLVSKKEVAGPKKNWIIEWNGSRTPVYAVNGPGAVFFVDEFGLQLSYEDSQITNVKGLLPKDQAKEIAVSVTVLADSVMLGYRYLGGSASEVHSCSLWRRPTENTDQGTNLSIWVQNCSYLKFKYQNRSWLNEFGQLVRLEYLLKRGYPNVNIFML